MVLALKRTLEGDPGKTLDNIQKKGLCYFILHLIDVSKYFFGREETKKKKIISEIFFPYSEKNWTSESIDFIEKKIPFNPCFQLFDTPNLL